jgi:hypothetical protein
VRFRCSTRTHRSRDAATRVMVMTARAAIRIINVTDATGHLLRRIDGARWREYVLIDNNRRGPIWHRPCGRPRGRCRRKRRLPQLTRPSSPSRERYIVAAAAAPPALLFEALDGRHRLSPSSAPIRLMKSVTMLSCVIVYGGSTSTRSHLNRVHGKCRRLSTDCLLRLPKPCCG